ncbi:MAG: cytochrome c3 family protein [Candidatus Binatia bacterium]
MTKITTAILSMVGLIALTSLAYAAGIEDTPHNLSSTGSSTIKGSTNEVCIYCHTPHKADAAAPLWNRLDSGQSYTLYNSTTFDATITQPSGVSKACLSCHDGTLGINQLVNRQGRGLGSNPANAGDDKISNTTANNPVAFLDINLADDHPISMDYTTAKSPGVNGAIGENTHSAGFRPHTTSGGKSFVDGNTVAGSAPTFPTLLPLYNGTLVQCASCHDPHQNTYSNTTGSESVAFLRVANTNSQLCRTCHLK